MTKHSDVKYMKDFNWNGFLNGEFAVNLRTQDNYDKFMHECEKRNYLEWCTKIKLLKQNIWKTYKENTCVDIDCGAMFYGNIKCYHDNNMPIFVYSNSKIFDECIFGLCSKTIVSLKRNILPALRGYMKAMGMTAVEVTSKNYMDVSFCGRKNRFYYFGGRDEGSSSLIQGVTLVGVLLDEAALMPRSFIEQAVARCSVAGSKLWFSCNPDNPYHWFKKEWIDKAEEKRLIYRHFVLEDNPTLDRAVIERYHRIYAGTFYERFVLGKWH